jgi:hypothetical protein
MPNDERADATATGFVRVQQIIPGREVEAVDIKAFESRKHLKKEPKARVIHRLAAQVAQRE